MLDFSSLPTKKPVDALIGVNFSNYNDELFMLKLPMHALKNPNLSYSNS